MECASLEAYLSEAEAAGVVLPEAEIVLLGHSLHALAAQLNASEADLFFWGKILAAEQNYFVAFLFTGHLDEPKKFFVSLRADGEFAELPRPSASALAGLADFELRAPLQGLPSAQCGQWGTEVEAVGLLVAAVDSEAVLAPRAALRAVHATRRLTRATTFTGVPHGADARDLKKGWGHFRGLDEAAALERRASCDSDIDFGLGGFLPEVNENNFAVRGGELESVLVSSLLWPGAVNVAIPNTHHWGSVYVGDGTKVAGLPFM